MGANVCGMESLALMSLELMGAGWSSSSKNVAATKSSSMLGCLSMLADFGDPVLDSFSSTAMTAGSLILVLFTVSVAAQAQVHL